MESRWGRPAQRRVAVIVEPAHPAKISPLLMSAYGLTEREQEVTRLVLQGFSTTDIAERTVMAASTVQQHLRNIFDKTGGTRRRDLVTKIFFVHYEPRLRDNEKRVAARPALRGGPRPQPIVLPSPSHPVLSLSMEPCSRGASRLGRR